jgi:hypothetical protein
MTDSKSTTTAAVVVAAVAAAVVTTTPSSALLSDVAISTQSVTFIYPNSSHPMWLHQ